MARHESWRTGGVIVWLAGAFASALSHAEPIQHPDHGAAAPPAMRAFLADPEFCAYMASSPDGESDGFTHRYELATRAVVQALRSGEASLTETAALFRLRARCVSALGRPSE